MLKWKEFVKEKSHPIEELLGKRFKKRELLIRALTRNAVLNEETDPPELRANGSQIGLNTIGDTVLDFVIIDHFLDQAVESRMGCSPEKLTELRKFYGNNPALHKFAKKSVKLQEDIIWGPDEITRKVWDDPKTELLADCFEALLGAIYLDKGLDGVKLFIEKIRFFKNMDVIS